VAVERERASPSLDSLRCAGRGDCIIMQGSSPCQKMRAGSRGMCRRMAVIPNGKPRSGSPHAACIRSAPGCKDGARGRGRKVVIRASQSHQRTRASGGSCLGGYKFLRVLEKSFEYGSLELLLSNKSTPALTEQSLRKWAAYFAASAFACFRLPLKRIVNISRVRA